LVSMPMCVSGLIPLQGGIGVALLQACPERLCRRI